MVRSFLGGPFPKRYPLSWFRLRNEGESAHIDTTTQETHTKGRD